MPSLHLLIITVAQTLVTALIIAIFLRMFLSFLVRDWRNPLLRFLFDITEPILAPLRRIIPVAMGLDFSPMIAVLGLWLVLTLVERL
jgi:YggT family protein